MENNRSIHTANVPKRNLMGRIKLLAQEEPVIQNNCGTNAGHLPDRAKSSSQTRPRP
jgi:hypothetical protein